MSSHRRLVAPFAIAVTLAGCASVLGIPDDVGRGLAPGDDEGGGGGEGGGGESGTNPEGAPPDTGPKGDGGGRDADSDAPIVFGCDPTKDFTAPVLLAGISTASNEGSARFSDDELTIYFDTDRGGAGQGYDLYTATRGSLAAAFGAATPLGGVNTAAHELGPSVTSDGRTLFFEQQDNGGVSRLYTATRAAASGPFTTLTALTSLNSNDYTANPFVRGNGTEIWYVNETAALLGIDVWHATTGGAGYVGAKVNVVNSPTAEEYGPVISSDGLTLFFGSDRTVAGSAGVNVFVATRATLGADFGAPAPLASVNGNSNEQPTWVSPDGCRLYLASNRPGGAGLQDIWVATRGN